MFRPKDSFSIGWDAGASAPAAASRPSTASSARLDPAAMPMAGARLAASPGSRGVAITGGVTASSGAAGQQSQAAGKFRETAGAALTGRGPPPAPNTPVRGVGGNTSMGGILSTPEAVPAVAPQTPRSSGRASCGSARRSQIDLSDTPPAVVSPPAAGARPMTTNSRLGHSAAGAVTRSAVSMSQDLDDTPLRTGKQIAAKSTARSSTSVLHIGGEGSPQPIRAAKSRPQTASARNESQFRIGAQAQSQPSPARSARPQTARPSSDIFNRSEDANGSQTARAQGRAHVAQVQHAEKAPRTARTQVANRNVDNVGLALGSGPSYRFSDPAVQADYNAVAKAASGNSNGNGVPPLRIGGIPSVSRPNGSAAVAPAEVDSGSQGGSTTRRAYNNARNASSLFSSDSGAAAHQPRQPAPQVPEMPATMASRQHIKVERNGTSSSNVKGLLGWD